MPADYYHASFGDPANAPFPREGAECGDCGQHVRTEWDWDNHTCPEEQEA